MPIEATNPRVIPAKEEIYYDKWATKKIIIEIDNLNGPCVARIVMKKARVMPDETWEESPSQEDRVNFEIDDVYLKAAEDPEWLDGVITITALVVKEATNRKLL